MPRITKAEKRISIVPFAEEAIKHIREKLHLEELPTEIYEWKEGEWYYFLKKHYFCGHNPEGFLEIRFKKINFRNSTAEQPKGNHITESAWIYIKDPIATKKCIEPCYSEKEKGYIIDGFAVKDYAKTAF